MTLGSGSTFRLGILATEYPPAAGGMEHHASNLVAWAAARHEVTLVTWPNAAPAPAGARHLPAWTGSIESDARLVGAQDVDAWLVLNAGWTKAVARGAGAVPMFAYVHGNDFLNPWVPGLPRWLALIERAERRLRLGSVSGNTPAAGRWRRRWAVAGLQQSRLIIANSDYTKRRCLELCRLPPARARVIAPGIDDGHFQERAAPVAPGLLRILTVSRLSSMNRRKNIDGLIEALALIGHDLAFELSVVGDGDDLARLEVLASRSGLGDRVRFLGRLEDAALDEVYRLTDLFVLVPRPSRYDIEGFGMVYAEAAARGIPVIGTRVAGIPDAIGEGVSGLFAEDASAVGVAAALTRFVREREQFDPVRIRQHAERYRASRTSGQLLDEIEAHTRAESQKAQSRKGRVKR